MERNFTQLSPWQEVIGHVLGWTVYTISTIYYQDSNASLVDILPMVFFIVPIFYVLVWLFQKLVSKSNFKFFFLLTILFLTSIYFITYLFIYIVLPRYAIYIADPDHPFSLSLYIIEISLGLGKLIIYAGSYVLIKIVLKSNKLNHILKTTLRKFELQALHNELSAHTQFGFLQQWQGLTLFNEQASKTYPVELASLYEYQFRATQVELVPLSEEISTVKHVAKLIRPDFFENNDTWLVFGRNDRLISLEDFSYLPFPPLALVSLLENACKYGDLTNKCNLKLIINFFNSELNVVLSNKIGKARPFIKSSGVGNKNLTRRLELLFSNQASFETHIENDFFYARIKITYHEEV